VSTRQKEGGDQEEETTQKEASPTNFFTKMLNRGNKLKEDSMEGIWDEKPEKLLGVGTVPPLTHLP
jgi:hypothetical protein